LHRLEFKLSTVVYMLIYHKCAQ